MHPNQRTRRAPVDVQDMLRELDCNRLVLRIVSASTVTFTHDRDANAAINIEANGLKVLMHPEDTGGVRA